MPYWLGPPGNLIQLPPPLDGIKAPRVRRGAVHELANGGQTTDTLGRKREYELGWEHLTGPATLSAGIGLRDLLYQLADGLYGPPPYVLLDPARANLLCPNHAAPTAPRADTQGWLLSTGANGSLSSLVATGQVGLYRVLQASITTGATNTVYAISSPGTIADFFSPVARAGATYTMSIYAKVSTGAVTAAVGVVWLRSDSFNLGESAGSTVALTSAYQRLTFTATAPATTAYAILKVVLTGMSGFPVALQLDGAQVEEAAAASAWEYGLGVPRVTINQLPDLYPKVGQHVMSMTLLEA